MLKYRGVHTLPGPVRLIFGLKPAPDLDRRRKAKIGMLPKVTSQAKCQVFGYKSPG